VTENRTCRAEALDYMPVLRINDVVQGFIPARSRLQIININVTTFNQDLTSLQYSIIPLPVT